jgi:hypothetical protein
MAEKFDVNEYMKFLKKAYSESDCIAIDLDIRIDDKQAVFKRKLFLYW